MRRGFADGASALLRDGDAGTRLRAAADGARSGDPDAFRTLVAETHATVFRLAVALVSDRDEAADVTQEAYVRAWGRIDELRDGAAALGWLCRIARNVAHDRRRSWWSRIRAPLDALSGEAAPAEAAPDAALASAERSAAVRRPQRKAPMFIATAVPLSSIARSSAS